MAVALRLMRFGKKGRAFYRIVALDKRKKRDGSYLDNIGVYDPMLETDALKLDRTKYERWIGQGAQPSEGLRRLMKNNKLK